MKSNLKLPIGLAQKTLENFANCLIHEALKNFPLNVGRIVEESIKEVIEKDSSVVDISKINFEDLMTKVKKEFIKQSEGMNISFEDIKAPENVISNEQK